MKAALTKQQWADFRGIGVELDEGVDGVLVQRIGEDRIDIEPERGTISTFDGSMIHALAALCLYDQEFGFTHEDVEVLREWASQGVLWIRNTEGQADKNISAQTLNLAERIEALLPPDAPSRPPQTLHSGPSESP